MPPFPPARCCWIGLSDGWWLRLQAKYDTERVREKMADVLAAIQPLARG
ncbi:MAG: hypothetical protein Q8O37_11090 [Sulfuricellaceae bacterium]|nr:hypothetical protein [Sulfuricellaceae bacterium]